MTMRILGDLGLKIKCRICGEKIVDKGGFAGTHQTRTVDGELKVICRPCTKKLTKNYDRE